MNEPHAPWPNFTNEEAEAVSRVLMSNKVNYWSGTETRDFEKEFAAFAGTNFAIAVANGTVALDLALQGLGIGSHYGGSEKDEVIVTPRSFIASASSIVNAGARPVFCDVDADSQNISPDTAAPFITANTRAILCVHLAGWPCDMDGFKTLINGRDIKLIEDCAQAHGAVYKGRSVGSLGDVAAWSFCQDKIMTTGGEGGMVTCCDEDLWNRMWSFKDHGKNFDAVYKKKHGPGFRWLHESIGTNWRLTEMQSAIGRIQLKRLPDWHNARKTNAKKIASILREIDNSLGRIRVPQIECSKCESNETNLICCAHAYYKFYAFLDPNDPSLRRDDIIKQLNESGLSCAHGTCSEIYLEQAFSDSAFAPMHRLPTAKMLGETSIMFQVHPGLKIDLKRAHILASIFKNVEK